VHFPSTTLPSLTEQRIHHISANHHRSVHPYNSNPSSSARRWVLEWGPGVCQGSNNNFFRNFFLDSNDILCYQRPEDVRASFCVPGTSRETVLRAAHGDSVLAGHPGIDRTHAAVSYAYYWPNLFANVAHFVRSCTVCAASKSSNQLRMGAESFSSIPLQPFTTWAMDWIGPLTATKVDTHGLLLGWTVHPK